MTFKADSYEQETRQLRFGPEYNRKAYRAVLNSPSTFQTQVKAVKPEILHLGQPILPVLCTTSTGEKWN